MATDAEQTSVGSSRRAFFVFIDDSGTLAGVPGEAATCCGADGGCRCPEEISQRGGGGPASTAVGRVLAGAATMGLAIKSQRKRRGWGLDRRRWGIRECGEGGCEGSAPVTPNDGDGIGVRNGSGAAVVVHIVKYSINK